MLSIIMLIDISPKLTPQVTTIICHYMKKVLLKKIQKYGETSKYLSSIFLFFINKE